MEGLLFCNRFPRLANLEFAFTRALRGSGRRPGADDLEAARNAATELSERAREADQPKLAKQAEILASSDSLERAREALLPISAGVIELLGEADGMVVMTCPMVENGRWLQDNYQVANPYMGQRMPACGMPERHAAK